MSSDGSGWQIATDRHMVDLIALLREGEWGCVTFASHLLRDGVVALPSYNERRILTQRNRSGQIIAAISFGADGLCLPELSATQEMPPEPVALGRLFTRIHPIRTIMGRRRAVEWLMRSLSVIPRRTTRYLLMSRPSGSSYKVRPTPPGCIVRRAEAGDLKRLLPLQIGYLREEVYANNFGFRRSEALRQLHHMLQRQLIYVCIRGNRIVAKCGTNARGFEYDQIGGLYSSRDQRRQGIGTAVLTRLLHDIESQHRRSCLFVKQHNRAAQALYITVDFDIRDELVVCHV